MHCAVAAFVGWGGEAAGAESREREAQRSASAAKLGFPSVTTSLRGAFTSSARIALAATMLAAVAPSHAQQETLYLRTLAANCAQCHGTEGHTVAGSPLQPLAGRSREELLALLKAFKAGTRPATIMQQLARGYSDAQLEQLAAFFAAQKR
ncbi:MAG TPA: c-type cytochrome [Ramlibacter sp.]|uniref:c-type cytochrome n=1 Tax=Ramlibacter sp. TaxID=1917967 RepID=UPI002D7E342F|nr:c-type cytochrome [Ramlibacter sp.]HET8745618.1 c-type cytochrome [Ramlibacter sp.]